MILEIGKQNISRQSGFEPPTPAFQGCGLLFERSRMWEENMVARDGSGQNYNGAIPIKLTITK
jgi:hypothetical protein